MISWMSAYAINIYITYICIHIYIYVYTHTSIYIYIPSDKFSEMKWFQPRDKCLCYY